MFAIHIQLDFSSIYNLDSDKFYEDQTDKAGLAISN
jgi:hypothetical protein